MSIARRPVEERPFLSLMVTPRSAYEAQPFLNRLTVTLLELVVVPGLVLLVGLLSIALWSALAAAGAPPS